MSDYVPKPQFKCFEIGCEKTFERKSTLNNHILKCGKKKDSRIACFSLMNQERENAVDEEQQDNQEQENAVDEEQQEEASVAESEDENEPKGLVKMKQKKLSKRIVKKMEGDIRRAVRKEERRKERREFKNALKGKKKINMDLISED